ncbi:MAG: cysteine peptidase family C39 domain-containing protein [Acidobacteriota bacterium]
MTDDRPIPFIPQEAGNDCGPACLAMTLSFHGRATGLDEVAGAVEMSLSGVDVWSLQKAARKFGLDGEGVRLEEEEALELLPPGSILHWHPEHFVVLESYRPGSGACIIDPAFGRREMTLQTLAKGLSGIALVLAPGPDFKRRPGTPPSVTRRQRAALRLAFGAKRLRAWLRSSFGLPQMRHRAAAAPRRTSPP